jgi:hypothetical protein
MPFIVVVGVYFCVFALGGMSIMAYFFLGHYFNFRKLGYSVDEAFFKARAKFP